MRNHRNSLFFGVFYSDTINKKHHRPVCATPSTVLTSVLSDTSIRGISMPLLNCTLPPLITALTSVVLVSIFLEGLSSLLLSEARPIKIKLPPMTVRDAMALLMFLSDADVSFEVVFPVVAMFDISDDVVFPVVMLVIFPVVMLTASVTDVSDDVEFPVVVRATASVTGISDDVPKLVVFSIPFAAFVEF